MTKIKSYGKKEVHQEYYADPGGRNKESKAGWEKIDEEICVEWPFIDDKFGGFEVWKLVSFLKTA